MQPEVIKQKILDTLDLYRKFGYPFSKLLSEFPLGTKSDAADMVHKLIVEKVVDLDRFGQLRLRPKPNNWAKYPPKRKPKKPRKRRCKIIKKRPRKRRSDYKAWKRTKKARSRVRAAVPRSTEAWAVVTRHNHVWLPSIRKKKKDAIAAAVAVEGKTWLYLWKKGLRARRVSINPRAESRKN